MVLIIGKTTSTFHPVTVNGRLSHEVLAIKEWNSNLMYLYYKLLS